MGGSNSGRSRERPHLGIYLTFDVRCIARLEQGCRTLLQWNSGSHIGVLGCGHGVELQFLANGDPVTQLVFVDRLPCHFGGTRAMMCCPTCGRRCRRLYLSGRRFVCRICTRSKYWTQSVSPDSRMVERVHRIQQRLAPDQDVSNYGLEWVPRRPKGMRQRTNDAWVQRLWTAIEKRDSYLGPLTLRMIERLAHLDQEGGKSSYTFVFGKFCRRRNRNLAAVPEVTDGHHSHSGHVFSLGYVRRG